MSPEHPTANATTPKRENRSCIPLRGTKRGIQLRKPKKEKNEERKNRKRVSITIIQEMGINMSQTQQIFK